MVAVGISGDDFSTEKQLPMPINAAAASNSSTAPSAANEED